MLTRQSGKVALSFSSACHSRHRSKGFAGPLPQLASSSFVLGLDENMAHIHVEMSLFQCHYLNRYLDFYCRSRQVGVGVPTEEATS